MEENQEIFVRNMLQELEGRFGGETYQQLEDEFFGRDIHQQLENKIISMDEMKYKDFFSFEELGELESLPKTKLKN